MTTGAVSQPTLTKQNAVPTAEQWIAGETAAIALIGRIGADMDAPADLALFLARLDGPEFDGACRALQKALRCRRG